MISVLHLDGSLGSRHFLNVAISFPELRSLDQRSENKSSGSNHLEITKEITEFCPSGYTQSASMAHA